MGVVGVKLITAQIQCHGHRPLTPDLPTPGLYRNTKVSDWSCGSVEKYN